MPYEWNVRYFTCGTHDIKSIDNLDGKPKLSVSVYLILTAQHRYMGGALVVLYFLILLVQSPI